MKRGLLCLLTGICGLNLVACMSDQVNTEEKHEYTGTIETDHESTLEQSFYGQLLPKELLAVYSPEVGVITAIHVSNDEIVEIDDLLMTYQSIETGTIQELRAETGGQVANLVLSIDEFLTTQTAALVIIDLDQLLVEFEIPTENADLFQSGQTVNLSFIDQEELYEATVEKVESRSIQVEKCTVRVRIDNLNQLKAGKSVEFQLVEDKHM